MCDEAPADPRRPGRRALPETHGVQRNITANKYPHGPTNKRRKPAKKKLEALQKDLGQFFLRQNGEFYGPEANQAVKLNYEECLKFRCELERLLAKYDLGCLKSWLVELELMWMPLDVHFSVAWAVLDVCTIYVANDVDIELYFPSVRHWVSLLDL